MIFRHAPYPLTIGFVFMMLTSIPSIIIFISEELFADVETAIKIGAPVSFIYVVLTFL